MKKILYFLICLMAMGCANRQSSQSGVDVLSNFLERNNLRAISLSDSDLSDVEKIEQEGIPLDEKQKSDLLQSVVTFHAKDYSATVAKILQVQDSIISAYFLIQYSDIEAIYVVNYAAENRILSHLNAGQISAGDLIFQDENKEVFYDMQRHLSLDESGSLVVSKTYEETTTVLESGSESSTYRDSVSAHYDIIQGKFVFI